MRHTNEMLNQSMRCRGGGALVSALNKFEFNRMNIDVISDSCGTRAATIIVMYIERAICNILSPPILSYLSLLCARIRKYIYI